MTKQSLRTKEKDFFWKGWAKSKYKGDYVVYKLFNDRCEVEIQYANGKTKKIS